MWKFIKDIKYRFNKAFEKNLINLIIFFIGISFIGVIFFSVIIFLFQKIGLLSANNFFTETLWQGFQLFFDQNAVFVLDSNKNNFFDFFFKFSITIFGIFIFSAIIGIVTNYISNRIESLRTGKTKIEEEKHIIFFNFSRRLIPLLSELCNAYEDEKKKKSFVVVTNEEPLTVMEKIKNVIPIPKNITIVARKGYAWQESLLDKINLEKANQIIILKPDITESSFTSELECDVEVGKSFSSIIGSDPWDKNPCKILAEFHNEERGWLHWIYSSRIFFKKSRKNGPKWQLPEIISSQILKNNLLAQCTNTPDLTEIYDNLFGYKGSEIYFIDPNKKEYKEILKKNIGKTLSELNTLCDNIIVIGFYQDDRTHRHQPGHIKIFLNTPIEFPLSENFGIICIAKNRSQIIKELNNLDKQHKNVKDIFPDFKDDDKDLNISFFDYSREDDNDYLKTVLNSIIESNYYDNLMSIKVYNHTRKNELIENKFLLNKVNYNFEENGEYHPNLGLIFHIVKTEYKNSYKFQVYSVNKQSPVSSKINSGDEILNVITKKEKKEYESQKNAPEKELYYRGIAKKIKSKIAKILNENDEIVLIIKKFNKKKIEFIEVKKEDINKQKQKILQSFETIQSNRQKMIDKIGNNLFFEEKDLNDLTKNMSPSTASEFKNNNCFIFFNETNQRLQKFRENPIEDHVMINNFVGFSYLKDYEKKISERSMITEINGYRTKTILEDFKEKFFSPYIGNDVIEMNSIISKYIAAAAFDYKNALLINLLFNRIHTIKAHTLLNRELKTNFCQLEKYFQNRNETLIGIIDYEFDYSNRKINHIFINPNQIEEKILNQGDRLITIANFNDLEIVNRCRYLHIL